jgi:hypothetical protein
MRFRLIAAVLALSLAGVASADPIRFVYTGTGSGSLNGTNFSGAAFTITALGDTADRQSFSSGFFIDHTSAMIEIAGVGTVAFVTATRTFMNNASMVLGFSRAGTGGADLYNGPFQTTGTTWDMLSDFSTSGTFGLLQWTFTNVDTTGGVLAFLSNEGAPGTFSATLIRDVPEPGTFGLLLGGMFLIARMRRRASTPV